MLTFAVLAGVVGWRCRSAVMMPHNKRKAQPPARHNKQGTTGEHNQAQPGRSWSWLYSLLYASTNSTRSSTTREQPDQSRSSLESVITRCWGKIHQLKGRVHVSTYNVSSISYSHVVPLDMKACICHFVMWQIHSLRLPYSRGRCILLCKDKRQWLLTYKVSRAHFDFARQWCTHTALVKRFNVGPLSLTTLHLSHWYSMRFQI